MKIPKIFHHCWLGPKPLPSEFKFDIATWKKLHPDWEFKFWTESNIPPLINQELYDNADTYSERTDVIRYELLYNHGGIWLDCDMECYKNIEPLINDADCFAGRELDGLIMTCVMGSTPKHPEFKKLIDNMPSFVKMNPTLDANHKTGPGYFTHTINQNNFKIFPYNIFYPCDWTEPREKVLARNRGQDYPHAYGTHHYTGSWVNKEGETRR
jgi:mannosyltransferase OCH1-like enzyme